MARPGPVPARQPGARVTERASTRHPSLVRQAMIVNSAMRLIAENGLAATTARAIANAADVSLGTVTYHFASIDDLLVQVLRAQTESFENRRAARLSNCTDLMERVLAFFAAYVDPDVHSQAMWRIWLDCWARAAHSPQLRNWQLTRYREIYDRIEAMLADGIDRGRFPRLDVRACARELVALVDGLGEQMLIDTALDSEHAAAILDGAIRRRLQPPGF